VTNPKSPKLTDGQAGNPFEADKHLHPQPPKATATTTHLLGAGELDCIAIIRQIDRQTDSQTAKRMCQEVVWTGIKKLCPTPPDFHGFPFFPWH